MAKLISSKHLEGVSDLTLSAPIRQGFIDAFEAVTYETRLRQIMEALFKVRSTAREYTTIKPFVDTAERIQSLLDFRLAIHGKELLLSATFDRPFEPYMRLIWDPLGPLLDVIFCNCEGYVTATEHGFEEYLAWVRRSQIDTDFFYASSGLTIDDIQYLVQVEKRQREGGNDASPLHVKVDDLMKAADHVRTSGDTKKESNELGIEALVALHKLTDLYPPYRLGGDGKYLLWATQQLLEGWKTKELGLLRMLVEEQLAWFESPGLPPRKQACGERLEFSGHNIQGGILKGYGNDAQPAAPVVEGALLLMRITDSARARAYLEHLVSPASNDGKDDKLRIRTETAAGERPAEDTFLNLAFTRQGLENIDLPKADLARFPQEFREGMEERAGLLGDIRENHPRNWNLPLRNGLDSARADLPVDMAEIDIVIQLRTTRNDDSSVPDKERAIGAVVQKLRDNPGTGLELLSIEPMRRAPSRPDITGPEHFGFADGIGQPKIASGPGPCADGETPLGDIFWGYGNSRTDSPPPPNAILDDGTFMVVRKLSQDVGGLRAFIKQEADRLHALDTCIDEDVLVGKLLGRYRDGRPVADPTRPNDFNDFTYDNKEKEGAFDDGEGTGCPFHTHVRRTHPRAEAARGRKGPRILRRGLSYGPAYDEDSKAPRGLFFMAYNASIAEQFEVIQRWMIGGNSTGIASWQNDPLIGTAPNGERTYQFVHDQKTFTVKVPEAYVKLQWGAYLFVPSISGIRAIAASGADRQAERQVDDAGQAKRGKAVIDRLRALAERGPEGRAAAAAEWKTCLEDFGAKDPGEKDEANAVWAAIRLHHSGAIRVPYGILGAGETPQDAVLVASKDLVMRVFRDPYDNYSMCGQMVRMRQSFGEIYLGMDEGPEYHAKSAINAEIYKIRDDQAFAVAHAAASQCIARTFALADILDVSKRKMDLRRHLITPALATICHRWFGIPDVLPPNQPASETNFVDPWGWSWEPAEGRKPRCPGDYMATSRFCFYPDPIPKVRAYGKSQGQALRKAVRDCFDTMRKSNNQAKPPTGILAPPPAGSDPPPDGFLSAVMANMPGPNGQLLYPGNDELARNVIGVMTGFLPPADGCLRWALYDWIEDKTLSRIQHDLLAHPAKGAENAFVRANEALRPWLEKAMQKRPAPDLLWRTAKRDHRLGNVEVAADDRVFVGIVSALAEDAAAGITDVYPVFGGERRPTPAKPEDRDYPLHACPAYKAAMGTMLGILAALLESVRIEPLPATLLVRVSEPSPLLKPLIRENADKIVAMMRAAASTPPAAPSEAEGETPPAAPAEAAAQGGQAVAGDDDSLSDEGPIKPNAAYKVVDA